MFQDYSAIELAMVLDEVGLYPHNTGTLSMLDEAIMAFGDKNSAIREAHRVFSTARHRHMGSYDSATGRFSDEAWDQAMVSAKVLADLLRPLGSTYIARCQRPAGWGTCNLPDQNDDGVCRSSLGHTD